MIASSATAVLPVCRSPMISWRWPRPIAVIASIALIPVCSGSFTGWRGHHVRRLEFEVAALGRGDVTLAVERPPERVDDAAEEAVADRDRQHLAGPADLLALLDVLRVAEDDAADLARRRGSARCPVSRPRTPAARWSSPSADPRRGRCRRRCRRRRRPPRAWSWRRRPRRCPRGRRGSPPAGCSTRSLVCSSVCLFYPRRGRAPDPPVSLRRASASWRATLASIISSPTRTVMPPINDSSTMTSSRISCS